MDSSQIQFCLALYRQERKKQEIKIIPVLKKERKIIRLHYLNVRTANKSYRQVRYWEADRNRIPYAAYRLMRLQRNYEMPGKAWKGWRLQGDTLWSPEGHSFRAGLMGYWSLTLNIARDSKRILAELVRVKAVLAAERSDAASTGLVSLKNKGNADLAKPQQVVVSDALPAHLLGGKVVSHCNHQGEQYGDDVTATGSRAGRSAGPGAIPGHQPERPMHHGAAQLCDLPEQKPGSAEGGCCFACGWDSSDALALARTVLRAQGRAERAVSVRQWPEIQAVPREAIAASV